MDQYGIKITPTNGINQICNLCKYKYANINVEPCSSCDKKSYYVPSDEGICYNEQKTINGTTHDVVNLNSDTQKELIDLRCELRVEKEKSKALEEYSRGLELKIKELEICEHPYKSLERNENGLFCNKCKKQISHDPNIY